MIFSDPSIHPQAIYFHRSYDLLVNCIAIGVLTADRLFSSVQCGTYMFNCIWAGVFD